MNEIVKTTTAPEASAEQYQPFKGYTLEELRYQRALTALKKDFSKAKLLRNVDSLRHTNPLVSKNKHGLIPDRFGSLASKVLSGLSYLDYAKMGFSLFSSGRKVYSLFKRKKK